MTAWGSPAFKIKITRETFQASRTLPVMSDSLKSLQKMGQTEVVVFFYHTTSDSVNPSSRIFVKLLDERKNIRARAGKLGKSGTEVVLRDGSIGGISTFETLSERLTKGACYASGRTSTNTIVMNGVRNGYLTRASYTVTPKTLAREFIFEKASKNVLFGKSL